jgi:hypothetical protein
MRNSLSLGALALLACSAFGANNLPAVCSNTAAEGQALPACATTAQTFSAATSASLVRSCSTVSCPYAERVWRKLADVSTAQFVEVCTSDKAEGAAITECQGATTTTWGAMAMVPPAQVARAVEAEPPFPGTFTVAPSIGNAPLSVTIAWNVSSFSGGTCAASGSWSGVKPLTGTQAVSNLTANAAYTLTCTRPLRGSASLQWTAPTRNTDGSALTDLSGFRLSYGATATDLVNSIQITSPATTSYIVGNLNAGTYHFGVRALASSGAESVVSNIVSKIVAAGAETRAATRTVTITTPQPEPPVLQVIDARVFNATPDYSLLAFRAGKQYGTVALGTRCDGNKPVSGGWYPVPSSSVRWGSIARTAYPVARCIVQ